MKTQFFIDKEGNLEHIGTLIGGMPNEETRDIIEIDVTHDLFDSIICGPDMKYDGKNIIFHDNEYSENKKKNIYKERRREKYPEIGDQLDAIRKHILQKKNEGDVLNTDVESILQNIVAIKDKYPKK